MPDPPSSSASCFASMSLTSIAFFRWTLEVGSVQRRVAQERCGLIQCVINVVERCAAINSRF